MTWSGCAAGSEATFCTIQDGLHYWPGKHHTEREREVEEGGEIDIRWHAHTGELQPTPHMCSDSSMHTPPPTGTEECLLTIWTLAFLCVCLLVPLAVLASMCVRLCICLCLSVRGARLFLTPRMPARDARHQRHPRNVEVFRARRERHYCCQRLRQRSPTSTT
jgi:hypothetical protein